KFTSSLAGEVGGEAAGWGRGGALDLRLSPRSSFARRSRGTESSPALLGPPDLLRRPLPGPLGGDVLVVGMVDRALGRVQLAEVEDVEPSPAQDLKQLRVADVKLGARPNFVVGPVQPMHPIQWPDELGADPLGIRRAHHLEVRR